MLSDISQTQEKKKNHDLTYMWNIEKKKKSNTKIQSRMVVIRGGE